MPAGRPDPAQEGSLPRLLNGSAIKGRDRRLHAYDQAFRQPVIVDLAAQLSRREIHKSRTIALFIRRRGDGRCQRQGLEEYVITPRIQPARVMVGR